MRTSTSTTAAKEAGDAAARGLGRGGHRLPRARMHERLQPARILRHRGARVVAEHEGVHVGSARAPAVDRLGVRLQLRLRVAIGVLVVVAVQPHLSVARRRISDPRPGLEIQPQEVRVASHGTPKTAHATCWPHVGPARTYGGLVRQRPELVTIGPPIATARGAADRGATDGVRVDDQAPAAPLQECAHRLVRHRGRVPELEGDLARRRGRGVHRRRKAAELRQVHLQRAWALYEEHAQAVCEQRRALEQQRQRRQCRRAVQPTCWSVSSGNSEVTEWNPLETV